MYIYIYVYTHTPQHVTYATHAYASVRLWIYIVHAAAPGVSVYGHEHGIRHKMVQKYESNVCVT